MHVNLEDEGNQIFEYYWMGFVMLYSSFDRTSLDISLEQLLHLTYTHIRSLDISSAPPYSMPAIVLEAFQLP